MKTNRIGLSRLLLAAALMTFAVPMAPAAAQFGRRPETRRPDMWRSSTTNMVRLGSKEIDGRHDRDSINVNSRGRFRAVMIKVTDSPARISNVVVHFENGESFRAPVAGDYRKGSFSQLIDLPGRARDIDHVSFRYSDLRGGRDADVVLFGIR